MPRFNTPAHPDGSGALLLPDALLVPDELYISPDLKIRGVVGDDASRRMLEELTRTKTEKMLRLVNEPTQARQLRAEIDAIDGQLTRAFGNVAFWLKGVGGACEANPWSAATMSPSGRVVVSTTMSSVRKTDTERIEYELRHAHQAALAALRLQVHLPQEALKLAQLEQTEEKDHDRFLAVAKARVRRHASLRH
jgi:hypothetical protein